MTNNKLIEQARECSICMVGASDDTRKSCKIDSCIDVLDYLADALEKTQERSNQSALNYQQKCRDVAELEQELNELKENGFCATCTGCNAPHDPDKITWCTDWEYNRK